MFKSKSSDTKSAKSAKSRSTQPIASSADTRKTSSVVSKNKVVSSLNSSKSTSNNSALSSHSKEKLSVPSSASPSNVKTSQTRTSTKVKSSARPQSSEVSSQNRSLHSKPDTSDKKYLHSEVPSHHAKPHGKLDHSNKKHPTTELSSHHRNQHESRDNADKKYLHSEVSSHHAKPHGKLDHSNKKHPTTELSSHHRNQHESRDNADKRHLPNEISSHHKSSQSRVNPPDKKPISGVVISPRRNQHEKIDHTGKKHIRNDVASVHRNPLSKIEHVDKKHSSPRPSSAVLSKTTDKSGYVSSSLSKHPPKSSHVSRNPASGIRSNYVSPLQRQSLISTRPHSAVKKDDRSKPSTVHIQKSNSMQNRLANKPRRNSAVKLSSDHSLSSRKDALTTSSSKKPPTLPLSSENKKPTKGLPPTAVVSPIQDKSKDFLSSRKEKIDDVSLDKCNNSKLHDLPSSQTDSGYHSPRKSQSFPNLTILDTPDDTSIETVEKLSTDAPEEKNEETNQDPTTFQMGHFFQPHLLTEWVNWCDACGGVILSLLNASVTCAKCDMVCHRKCALAVSLTCAADENLNQPDLDNSNINNAVVEKTKDEATLKEFNTIKRVLPLAEVQDRIDVFNRTVKGIQQMTLLQDGETFRGFIRVFMNLSRPVSVTRHWSKLARKISEKEEKKASFYVDKGALKALHVTSDTTSDQVVRMLLQKYNITDNPMKFALFEKQAREEDHIILRKMLPRERPLFLRLLWGNGNENDTRQFLLQENESRDIEWEAFSVGELQMFIKILNKEENDYVIDIKRKYTYKAEDIKKAMEYQNRSST